MVKVMTQLDLFTKYVIGSTAIEVTTIVSKGKKTYKNDNVESLNDKFGTY